MSKPKKVFLIILLALIVFSGIAAGGIYFFANKGLPVYSGEITVPGLENEVVITRDERGVPYIDAKNLDDLFFAQGFVHAQERLWQMEVYRRVHTGRLSEVIGEEMLEMDIATRKIGLDRVTERIIAQTSPLTVTVIESYVDGINAFLAVGEIPPEFRILGFRPRLWTLSDVVGTVVLVAYQLGMNWSDELVRLSLAEGLERELFHDIMPPYKKWKTTPVWKLSDTGRSGTDKLSAIIESMNIGSKIPLPKLGSNSWVVAPELTESGYAMLANDPHMDMSIPNVLFENQLRLGEEITIHGWSIPGGPGVITGHNSFVAWGITNIGDSMDLCREKRDSKNPYNFLKDDIWYEAEVITEEIPVRGRKPEPIEIIITKNGPLISEDPPLSLRWAGYEVNKSTADAMLKINLAKNWEEFKDGLFHFSTPIHNVVYADKEGNIAFRTVGQLPVRKKGLGIFPSPGWDSEYDWMGYIPNEELPELYNPTSGFIVTANHKVVGDDYPYIITHDYAPPYRMERITKVLKSKEDISVEDFKELQNDWYNLHAFTRLPRWLEEIEPFFHDMNKAEKQAYEILLDWAKEPVNDREEAGPVIFQTWYLNCMEEIFAKRMGENLYASFLGSAYLAYNAFEYILERGKSPWIRHGLTEPLYNSFLRTIEELTADWGNDPRRWQWQKIQTATLKHLMGDVSILAPFVNRGPFPYGGDHMTVGRAAYKLHEPFIVDFGATMRYIAHMKPDVEAYTVMAGGQSGHFLSPHYDDQIETWLNGEFYPIRNSEKEIPEDMKQKLKLIPQKPEE